MRLVIQQHVVTGCWPHGPSEANIKDNLLQFWAEYGVFEAIKYMGHGLPAWAAVCIGSDNTVAVPASEFTTTTFETLGISSENASSAMVHFMHESVEEGPAECYNSKVVKKPI